MPEIPHLGSLDSSVAFKRDPYGFISKHCRQLGSDVFQTRLLGQKSICMTGEAACELFYDPQRFVRHRAAPLRIQKTLFGAGGVQSLDDEAHRHRKRMFMALMTPERIARLAAINEEHWERYAGKWKGEPRVVLYEEAQELLTRSVCAWAGVPLPEEEVARRTRDLTALFDFAGAVGPWHWISRHARGASEKWIGSFIDEVRQGRLSPPRDSAAHAIAFHHALDGYVLSTRDAAVELLNVLRPTVAVSVYIVQLAHALHEHPECRQQVQAGNEVYTHWLLQEVRRFYPFFPAVVARVRDGFDWSGYRFEPRTRALLDLYGINHDPRIWASPDAFRPERFAEWNGSPFNFVPQGGGDHFVNHRCPGEWITIELMRVAARILGSRLTYTVPEQDLRIDTTRLPAIPHSRFVMTNVQ